MRARTPASDREIVRTLGGGSRQRARVSRVLSRAVRSFFDNAVDMYGEERAAVLLFHLLAKAGPDSEAPFDPPAWSRKVFQRHQAALFEEFASPADDDTHAIASPRRRAGPSV